MHSLWSLASRSTRINHRHARLSTMASAPTTTASICSNSLQNETSKRREKPRAPAAPPVVAHVVIDRTIMDHLQLRSNQHKSRFLLSTKQLENTTISRMREMIESRIVPLTAKPYKLQYKLHNHHHHADEEEMYLTTLHSDAALQQAVQLARQEEKSLQLYVKGVVGSFPPIDTTDPYAIRADPLESTSFTMVSFFSFHPIANLEAVAEELHDLWAPFHALGRAYLATEGVNAQMAIPTNVFGDFTRVTKLHPLFAESRFNTDPPVPKEEYLQTKPFRALHIRIRDQILADGLKESLDWKHAGTELDPLDWHRALDDPQAVILDCRNTFETDVGTFQNAIPLQTSFFRESWVALEEVLKDTPKDTPVLTFCTGGIRCVKINAFLEQKMGFHNTHRLKGGIIAYRRELEQAAKSVVSTSTVDKTLSLADYASKFKGVNYVFDERISERITDDVFTHCETCGASNDAFTNCKNYGCNVRLVQCNACRARYHNCCSEACKMEYQQAQDQKHTTINQKSKVTLQTRMLSKLGRDKLRASSPESSTAGEDISVSQPVVSASVKTHALQAGSVIEAMNQYCEKYSEPEPALLRQLRQFTDASYPQAAARMISSASQGAVLSFLASLNQAKTVLELGSFTGYSALSLALDYDAFTDKLGSTGQQGLTSSRHVFTCEIDPKAASIATDFFQQSGIGEHITLHPIPGFEMIAQMKANQTKFDMVFIDADKKKYQEYVQQVIGEDAQSSLLNHGALIVVDNTLWKGLVLQQTEEWKEFTPNAEDFGSKERFEKLAEIMHGFNSFVAQHPQLRTMLLPMRDGLTVMRYVGGKKPTE